MELTTAMLADHAVVADGKLYISGGQWDRIFARVLPSVHPSLSLVLVIRVEYNEALDAHALSVVLMKDGEPVGPEAVGQLAVGHPPLSARGAPTHVPLVLPFQNLKLNSAGRYEWVVTVDGAPLGNITMEVGVPPQP